jgi:tripartite-type tricarboxylate transporter receptor subunit TctC
MGLLAPVGTPQDIVDRLSQAANDALKAGDVLEVMHKQGVDPLGGSEAEFAKYIDSELKKWASVAAAAGLKAK